MNVTCAIVIDYPPEHLGLPGSCAACLEADPRIPIPESRALHSHGVVAGPPAAPSGSGGLGGVRRGRQRSSAACSMQFYAISGCAAWVVKCHRICAHEPGGRKLIFHRAGWGALAPLLMYQSKSNAPENMARLCVVQWGAKNGSA